ncbi:hypothetical protein F2Q70_00020027 [Brassica cretica]|uniref:Cation efflux protein cytoplasmic domain-containing protein n=1 Tax=Brassica cretica TaxID=69181 RepID=A0A8S9GIT3_BRACR|nr:hypothetical protein F2Q70_00020027 [Brassica cretica]
MATEHIIRTSDQYNVELLASDEDAPPLSSSWRLSLDTFRLPSSSSSTGRHDGRTRFFRYFRTPSEFVVLRVSVLLLALVICAQSVSCGSSNMDLLYELNRSGIHMNSTEEKWMIGIMVSVTIVKFLLMLYCRGFQNEIVRAYAQDHLFDVVTNSIGLATAVLAVKFYWWIDPSGAILIALYTIGTWARTVLENVHSLIGRSAPPDFLAKLTFLIWNHHEQIKHIDTVRAYTFGSHYFVEVDIVLPEDMRLQEAHNIGETLQEKLEQLAEVERAFVHIDFEFTHRPEHKYS